MRKIKILSLVSVLTLALMSFALEKSGCGCGSMESGTQIIYSTEGDCCKGEANDKVVASVIDWAPGETEGTYVVISISFITNNEAQGKCCDLL